MTVNPELIKQQKARRLQELSYLARQRYLKAGGDPLHSSNDQDMTQAEQQEFQLLLEQVFDDNYIQTFLTQKRQKSQKRPLI